MPKTSLALDYVIARYEEEQSRFSHIEKKSSSMILILTGVISVFVSLIALKGSEILSPSDYLDFLTLGLCFTTVLCMASSWFHALLALKVGVSQIAAKNRENLDYIWNQGDEESIKQIYACYANTLESLSPTIDKKAKNLEYAYQELSLSGKFLIAFAVLTILSYKL